MGPGEIVTREHLHMLVDKLQNPESELYLKALELIMSLAVTGSLSKEICVAIYLFTRWVVRFRRKGGWLNTALYLNTCGHALIYNYGGTFEKETRVFVSISLSRDGIPRCIPEFHRRMIRMRDCKADRLVQLDLSFFSISKLILLVRARPAYYAFAIAPNVYASLRLLTFFQDKEDSALLTLPLLRDHSSTLKAQQLTGCLVPSEPGITAGIEVSRTQGDAAAGCHGSGAP
ncbi:hypothetical protein NE237_014286 [Protea cynaroides]|uniref:Uncharacterized protein n=1 Tax=Protea cynaroides TaxID=273540 RepID=A0A9Q0JSH6_9MAGN|nr:hypothetical protein NE237_014178 [Protea cynaroides]KAJ4949892.1 hypothetical protein NE237_014286 [Protea cynaroides]